MPKSLYPRWVYSADYDPKTGAGAQLVATPEAFDAALAEGWATDPAAAKGEATKAVYDADDDEWAGDRPNRSSVKHVPVAFPRMVYAEDYDPVRGTGAVKATSQEAYDALLAEGYLAEPLARDRKGNIVAKPSSAVSAPTAPAAPASKPTPVETERNPNDPFDPTTMTSSQVVTLVDEMTDPVALQAVLDAERLREKGIRRPIESAIKAKLATLGTGDATPTV
jgi:hypothetical protein